MLHVKHTFKADFIFRMFFLQAVCSDFDSVQEENLCITFGFNLMFGKMVAM